jgi:hypothetical protein
MSVIDQGGGTMADQQESMPEGFKQWPPNGDELIREIEAAWASTPGAGRHWIVQVTGTNPLSGYTVIKEPHGGGH